MEPRAVVLSIPRLPLAPAGARVYVSIGDVDARALAGGELPAELSTARALLVNEREARLLTGLTDTEAAAARTGRDRAAGDRHAGRRRRARRGRRTASSASPGSPSRRSTRPAPAISSPPPTSGPTTGAPGSTERLRWAVLYASLSVRVATAVAGAVTLRALLEEGAEHGLASPVRQPSAAMKEDQ